MTVATISLPLTGALFNEPARTRRYWLGRDVASAVNYSTNIGGHLLIIGLNPSTADETANDPTVRKEMKYACAWGFHYLDKCNIFDWRSTDPAALYDLPEPVSDQNELHILAAAARARMILCAWGKHGTLLARGARTKRVLKEAGYRLHYLHLNGDGSPRHPLYIRDDARPSEWL